MRQPRPAATTAGRALLGLAAVGGALTIAGTLVDPARTAAGILLASHLALGLSLGGLLFVAFGHVLRAGWHVAFRRVPEALADALPVGTVATVAALAFVGLLYPWSHAAHVQGDEVLEAKTWWLSVPAFLARSVVVLGVWMLFARALRRASLRQDRTHDLAETERSLRLSTLLLVVFALTFSVASVDWLMSLEPHWYSTVWAIYDFSGAFTSGLAAVVLLAVGLRRAGRLPELREDHLHDLGKLLLSFSTFWAYIWFCQHMLIWYANIPEETVWFAERQEGAWAVVHVLNPVLGWLVPFLVLLPRAAKRNESVLLRVCVLLLAARWLDLWYVIGPTVSPGSPAPGPFDLAPLAVVLPILLLVALRAFARAPRVPVGDPYLGESLHHHV